MLILGIETSCDETGVAIYDSEKGLLGHKLYSQIKLHAKYGGVVPELASRDHINYIIPLINELLKDCKINIQNINSSNSEIYVLVVRTITTTGNAVAAVAAALQWREIY